jgi:hypothetical protein
MDRPDDRACEKPGAAGNHEPLQPGVLLKICVPAEARAMVRPKISSGEPLKVVGDSAPVEARPVMELSIIRLRSPVETTQGIVPVGSSGTVVHPYSDGQAYTSPR